MQCIMGMSGHAIEMRIGRPTQREERRTRSPEPFRPAQVTRDGLGCGSATISDGAWIETLQYFTLKKSFVWSENSTAFIGCGERAEGVRTLLKFNL